jgi:hypothetical protein
VTGRGDRDRVARADGGDEDQRAVEPDERDARCREQRAERDPGERRRQHEAVDAGEHGRVERALQRGVAHDLGGERPGAGEHGDQQHAGEPAEHGDRQRDAEEEHGGGHRAARAR